MIIQFHTNISKSLRFRNQLTWPGDEDYYLIPVIGLDTESTVHYGRQPDNVDILQIAVQIVPGTNRRIGKYEVFIFHLAYIGLPACVVDLLIDKDIIKVGVNIHGYVLNWYKLY